MIKPTMFNAFINTMSKPHIAKQSARKIVAAVEKKAEALEQTAMDILQKSGADAQLSCRVKGVNSTVAKQIRYLKDFDTYPNQRENIHNIILGKGMSEIIGDSFGARFTANTPDVTSIYNAMLNKAKNDKNFFLTSIENYFGQGTKPYANERVTDDFAKLVYKNTLGKEKHTTATNSLKKSGYTRSNINAIINGVNTEIQVGGKYTTVWGNAEHFLHDKRLGKAVNLGGLSKEQIKTALEVERDYGELLKNKAAHDKFMKEYLTPVWEYLKRSEDKNLAVPEFPPFPKGYSKNLTAENIMRLGHV